MNIGKHILYSINILLIDDVYVDYMHSGYVTDYQAKPTKTSHGSANAPKEACDLDDAADKPA